MFFELKAPNCPKLSYMLCKNPANVYERDFNSRKVLGQFPNKNDDRTYQILLKPDVLDFVDMAKKRNLDCYLNSEIASVCPYNLKVLHEALRSVIRGNNASGGVVSDEEFNSTEFDLSCVFGPFENDLEYVSEAFEKVGIDVTIVEATRQTEVAHMFEFSLLPDSKMNLTEFLQKIYVVSLYVTYNRYSVFNFDENVIEKIILLSKNWLFTNELLRPIVNKFCRFHDNLRKKFQTALEIELEEGEEKDEKLQQFEKKLKKISLHEKRHQFVTDKLKELNFHSLVDFCSSEGKLLTNLLKEYPGDSIQVLGIEAAYHKVKQLRGKMSGNPKSRVIESDILHPNIDAGDLLPDVLTCIEAIEHFDAEGRKRIIELIRDLFVPKYLFLTTPNIEYNVNYGLEPGQYRRNDHIIEYDLPQFVEEVMKPLSKDYDIQFHLLYHDEEVQPSFCIFCTHKSVVERTGIRKISKPYKNQTGDDIKNFEIEIDDSWTDEKIQEWLTNDDYRKQKDTRPRRKINRKLLNKIKKQYRTTYLPGCGYSVRENELVAGYTSRAFMTNGSNVFYLAPTIAPVESIYEGEGSDYIEHPESAFNYYLKRGITDLIEEKKYMGSRAYILAFRDIETAKHFGFNNLIIVNSRNGFPFFNSPAYLQGIWDDIMKNLPDHMDFIMLDAEITPWSYKAEGMIDKQFVSPAECLYLSRHFQGEDTTSCEDYFNVLQQFTKDEDVKVYPFHVLTYGSARNKDYNHGYHDTHFNMLWLIEDLCKDATYLSPCEWNRVDLLDGDSRAKSIQRWEEYCNYDENFVLGEGFVYKPTKFTKHTKSGYYIQPALKVRGREYLRMVYGIDMYSIDEYFKMIKNRTINKKRSMAAQQFEMSKFILDAFIHNDRDQRKQFVASFLGMENVSFGIDKTL